MATQQLLPDKLDDASSTNAAPEPPNIYNPGNLSAPGMRIEPAIERVFPLLVGHLKSGRMTSSLQSNLRKYFATFDATWARPEEMSFLNTHTIHFAECGQTRQVNAYILSCQSEYFRAMFHNATSTKINIRMDWLKPILPQMIEVIESFNFTGCHVTITDDNCLSYFLVGDFLLLDDLRSMCLRHISESCKVPELWAGTFNLNLPDLIAACSLPLLRDFAKIRHTNSFLDMKPDALIHILEHKMLTCSSELRVIEAIGNWMAHQPSQLEERKQSLKRLLRCVRIRQMTPTEMEAAEKLPAAIECCEFRECLKCLRSPRPDPAKIPFLLFEQKDLTRCQGPRRPLRVILTLVLEEPSASSPLATCLFYDHQAKTWGRKAPDKRSLPKSRINRNSVMPSNTCCVSVGHRVYLIGGSVCGIAHSRVLCFNSRDPSRRWQDNLPRMTEVRVGHCCALVGGFIYAAGGRSDNNYSGTVERMAPSGNSNWSQIDPMLTSRCCAAATEHRGKLIVAGGMEVQRTLDTAEIYCPETGVWTVLSGGNMCKKRHSFSLITCDDCVYAVCGNYEKHYMRSIERWEEGRSWKKCVKIETGRSHFGCAAIDSRIYIFGGFNGEDLQSMEWVDVSRASRSRPLLGLAEPVPLKGEVFATCLFEVEMEDDKSATDIDDD